VWGPLSFLFHFRRPESCGRIVGYAAARRQSLPGLDAGQQLQLGEERSGQADAVIRHGRRRSVRLVEIPASQRAPVLKEYVRIARSGRRHFPVAPSAPLSEFDAIADRYPVFRIDPH
jgi:hypothetical protein